MPLNLLPATPSQAMVLMYHCWKVGETVFLHGNPGIGKTSLPEALALEIGGPVYKFLLTQIEACDLRGLPYLDAEAAVTRWLRPEFLPTHPGPGIIMLDELTAAEHRLQKSAYQLLLERRVGQYRVPDGFLIVGTGNTGADGAIVHQMDTPAAGRMVHILLTANVKDWIAWARRNTILTEVIAYVQSRPDDLDGTDKQVAAEHLLGPTPRGWARVSRLLEHITDRRAAELGVAGILGESTAHSFLTVYDEIRTYASVQTLCETGLKAQRLKLLPKSIPGLYNLAYGLAAYAADQETVDGALTVATELHEIDERTLPLAEVQTLAMEMLLEKIDKLKMLPEVVKLPAYKKYAAARKAKGL